jgi:hypothetical protein
MTLEPGWVEAIAAVITALIILGTAVTAFAQLRQMDRDYASLERDPRSPYPKPTTGGPTHA